MSANINQNIMEALLELDSGKSGTDSLFQNALQAVDRILKPAHSRLYCQSDGNDNLRCLTEYDGTHNDNCAVTLLANCRWSELPGMLGGMDQTAENVYLKNRDSSDSSPVILYRLLSRQNILLGVLELAFDYRFNLCDDAITFLSLLAPRIANEIEHLQLSAANRKPDTGQASLETELLDAIEAMSDGFILYDESDRIVAFNSTQGTLFPSTTSALKIGNNFEDLLRAQTDSEQINAAIGREEEWIKGRVEAHRNPKEPYEQEFADGRTIRLTEKSTASGGTVAIRTDITELKANQSALEQSNAQYEDLLELNPDAVIVQVDGIVKYANTGAVRIFGAKNRDELIGIDGIALAHPDYRAGVFDRRDQMLRTGAVFTAAQTMHIRLDGTVFDSEVSAGPVTWENEKGSMNIIRDITRRKEVERTLANEQERFRDLTHATFDWYWESDENFRFTYMSGNVEGSGLHKADSYIGKSQREILGDDAFEAQESLIEFENKFKAQLPFRDITYWRNTENSERKIWVRTSGLPFYDDTGNFKGYRGSSSNISDQMALQQQLEQAQKMEAVGQLTGGVAHDFNNLLNVIQGNVEILQENSEHGIPLDSRQFDKVLRATTRGAELTQRMLAFSRKQDLKPQTIQLNDELISIVDILKRTIREDISLAFHFAEDLWPCKADLGQVENAILNLALNARDAMPGGGTLTIEVSNVHLSKSSPTGDSSLKADDYILLTVSDTGEGIAAEDLSKVFEPFYTTKDVGKGSGLGLSMVYGFARQSNGHASISSELGVGTTVKLYLPRAD